MDLIRAFLQALIEARKRQAEKYLSVLIANEQRSS